jgi:hypothetical protein
MDPLTLALLMGGGTFLKWFLSNQANNQAAGRQNAALGQAQGAIQGAADKAMSYQEPYLKNAGKDFEQLRHLVQTGFFHQPYGKSFQSQSFQGPSFAFNPSQGKASFASWQPQGGPASFTPQALPGMPAMPAPAAAAPAMVRPNAAPIPLSDWTIAAGAKQADSFPRNLPGGWDVHNPARVAQNPYLPNSINGGDLPYTPASLGNQPKTIGDLLRIMRDGSLPRGPGGSDTFIPRRV